jgi:hypothetical protein
MQLQSPIGQSDIVEETKKLRHLLETVRCRGVAAPASVVARLEGAVIALDALATGKMPDTDDLLVPGPYTI